MSIDLILPVGNTETGPPVTAELIGELEVEDVMEIAVKSDRTISSIKRVTGRHQAMARAVALGTPVREVAALFGMAPASVHRLRSDPAFQNLVEYYQKSEDEVFYSTQERLRAMTNLAVDRIVDKLEDDEVVAKMSTGQLLDIVTAGADRTGNGVQSTNVSVNVNTDLASRMQAAREKANASMKTIPGEVKGG